jgi:putative adenylate-forming enzyme
MDVRLMPRFLLEVRNARRRERWSRQRMLRYQAERLARIRAHALANSPFYREHHRGLENAPLSALPIVTKRLMMERFDDLVTDRRIRIADVRRHMDAEVETGRPFLGDYVIVTSSGSTGEVTVILSSPEEHVDSLAIASRSRAFAGYPWNPIRTRRVAQIAGALPWLSSAQSARTEKSRFAPLLALGAGQPIDRLVPELNRWDPEILEGYSSILGVLAQEQLAGRLRIHPKLIGAGGETLTPEIRERILQAWHQDPFDYYGTVEGGTHAVECREGRRLHLMDDAIVLEVVDDDHRPVPPGEPGTRVLITSLFRTTQPLIRYELTDSVTLATDPCPCGRPFQSLAAIQGRLPRLLEMPSADGSRLIRIPSMAFSYVANLPVMWRRLTLEDGRIVISVVGVAPDFDAGPTLASLARVIEEHGTGPVAVDLRILPEIPRTAAGKAVVDARPT